MPTETRKSSRKASSTAAGPSNKRPREPEQAVRRTRTKRTLSPSLPSKRKPVNKKSRAAPISPTLQRQKAKADRLKGSAPRASANRRVIVLGSDDEASDGSHEVLGRTLFKPAASDDDEQDEDEDEYEDADEDDDDLEHLEGRALVEKLSREAISIDDDDEVEADDPDSSEKENRVPGETQESNRARQRRNEVPHFTTPDRKQPSLPNSSSPVFISDGEEDSEPETGGTGAASAPAGPHPLSANDHNWPVHTHLVPPPPGVRNIRLKEQRSVIRTVLATGITRAIYKVLFRNPFPSIDDDYRYHRDLIVEVATQVGQHDVAKRVKEELTYALALARVIVQRLSNLRGNWKQEAARKVELHYRLLGSQQQIKERVDKVLSGFTYVYEVNSNDTPIFAKPFLHSCILAVLRQCVFTEKGRTGSLAHKYDKGFRTLPSTSADAPQRRAIPDAMVCLAAAVTHAALDDWKNGIHQPTPFSADTYEDVYNVLGEVLDTIREARQGAAYDYLMAKIYTECGKGTASSGIASTNDALKLVDIENMPVSDD
ncbi:hypothetical protein CC1G_11668 [Coprinopsis cinerea okayama7|uniref:DUF6532 domain-containing protein n=1 Tax=Coprinopsis cinerea (strain Okayama-7 / 130 / ATCC MYA-4618 / FGSC 9003) TaxID=240176 RepID=A8P3S8_COPC7|nr:hypothetical protein CC1G_11668 [Coprinopsis cinerea okayama7\|eukprot:XP_001838606.2 hypothetical protein CC1G_11668 [Coprinopsis cinerea okayama7\